MFLYRGNNFVSKMSASSDVCSPFLEVSSREKIKANVPETVKDSDNSHFICFLLVVEIRNNVAHVWRIKRVKTRSGSSLRDICFILQILRYAFEYVFFFLAFYIIDCINSLIRMMSIENRIIINNCIIYKWSQCNAKSWLLILKFKVFYRNIFL